VKITILLEGNSGVLIVKTNYYYSVFLLVTLLYLPACDSKSPVQTADDIGTVASAVSECGGFSGSARRSGEDIPFTLDPETYEDAERLLWQYDKKTAVLSVMNARVILNCCGDHAVSASQEKDTVIIAENDQPEDGSKRCRCLCAFDFFIELSGISPRVVPLKLTLTVDDSTWTKWQGDIDLAGESGDIIIPVAKQAKRLYRR